MSTFGLRIFHVDYCMVKPNAAFDDVYSEFCERETSLVPVIRIFGITRQGKKGCLHVHGCYPYLSIPFDPERHINVPAFKKKLAEEFNKLLSSTNTNYFRTRSSKAYNYVYRIETFKGIPFYGYHSTERTFLRIYFYNPASVEKAKNLLENGKVMNTVIQTYEAHISYILKFFIDYNLYGMNFIDVRSVQFRFMENNVYNSDKATTCEIEGDCIAADILNRESMSTDGRNPGLKSMWDEQKERQRIDCLSSQITPQCSQERENNEITSKENNYFKILKNILFSDEEEGDESLPSSSPSVNYNTSDFAKIFLDCLKTKPTSDGSNGEKSEKQNYTVEEVTEVFSQLTQTRKRHESGNSEDSELSQDNVLTNGCNYSEVLMDIIRDRKDIRSKNAESTSRANQCSQSSNVSNKSYTTEDFVKLMVGVIKENKTNDTEEKNATQCDRSYSCEDFVETMICHNNVSGINRSEEEDENKITEEMSQVFTSVDENVGVTKAHSAAQTSPLDLATSPSSTITEYYGFEEVGAHMHKHGTPVRNEAEDQDFVEVVCDCNSNECCDLCCDRRSDLCDCEGGQCTKIPQLDGSYDCTLRTSKQRSKIKSSTVSNCCEQIPLSSMNLRVPQVDGSWDVHIKSDKVSRTKRRPRPFIQPLPFLSNENSNINDNLDSKSTRSRDEVINGHVDDRKVVNVLGYDLRLPNSLDMSFLPQIGQERLVIKRLTSEKINRILRRSEKNTFDESDRCEFYSTNLTGKKKLNHLLSLCKPLEIKLESEDNISEASDDTLIDTQEVLQFEQLKNEDIAPKSLTENQAEKTLTHSIDNILNNSAKDNYSDDDYLPPTPEYALQSNKENDIGSSPVSSNFVFVEDEDEATQDYWKNDSPKKVEGSPLKSTENAEIRENESESELCNHVFPLNSDGNQFELQNEIYTQVQSSNSQTNNSEPENYTKLKYNICSQESNKSQKSVGESSRVSISDSIVSFYEMESPVSSPVAGTSNCFDLSSPPAISFLSSSKSNICSTPLDAAKEIKSHKNKKKRTLSFESEKVQQNSQKRKNTATPIISQNSSNMSIIEGVKNSQGYDFELSSIEEGSDANHTHQYLTTMSLEVFTTVSGDLKPNPTNDAIRAIFYGIHNDIPEGTGKSLFFGIIIVEMDETDFQSQSSFNFSTTNFRKHKLRIGDFKDITTVTYAVDELDLYMKLVEVLKTHDPDIVVGYEIELLSWGYVLQRATALNIQIAVALSRVIDEQFSGVPDEETIQMYGVKITGRVVLNLWRVLTSEITLNMYSFENVNFHVLHERATNFSHRDLNLWFDHKMECWRTITFYLDRVAGYLELLNKLNLVQKYSEFARVFGIQFYEVLSRGSQFRVESMMSRTAKAYNYVMVSPSVQQKVKMRAPEMIALTLEPESNFYTDPVVVLDFQSLYPSVMIAYNYCYSTCLGRLEHFSGDKKFPFGCSSLYTSKNTLKQHINNIHIAPNAVAFVKPEVRRGVLPQMLTEILETRVMVKNAMKENDKKAKPNKALKKLLNARQLGLKLIANVTYGYTGANFSGRMPCVEIADAIVSKGREALENAINLVNSTKKWGGKVIYGDTDSLFILFPGCSKEEAFKRGHEIADTVTQMNPKPMKLKFEKVFMPCVLQTKKRYVGFSYESVDQKEPTFDAKGIETVRRDTCAAASKILEKSLKILFTTFDTTEVKLYVQRQFQKILNGRISNLQDFIFAKEYRGRENYAPNACVPALQIANRLRSIDPRAEPRKHERVPYVIVYGSDDQPLIELVRQPLELVTNPSLRLNAMYYIERVIIPPLNRVFKMMDIDVLNWFKEVPRKPVYQRSRYYYCKEQGIKPKVISEYFVTRECPVCKRNVDKHFPAAGAANDSDLCFDCQSNWQLSALAICGEIRDLEMKFGALTKICQSCSGSNDIQQKCRSIDCPQLFRVAQTNMDLATIPYLNSLLKTLEIKKASLQF